MKRAVITALFAAAGFLGASASLPVTSDAAPVAHRAHASTSTSDPVVAWNQFLLGIQATPGDQPATVAGEERHTHSATGHSQSREQEMER